MIETLAGGAEELAHLADLIRASRTLADCMIPSINFRLTELAVLGIDNCEIEGPLVYSRAAGCSAAFDDSRIVYAAAFVMPHGLGSTLWAADEHAMRYDQFNQEPPLLQERFVTFDQCPPIVRAMLSPHVPGLLVQLFQNFSVLIR